MSHNIQSISKQLVQAVDLIMSPYTPTAQRIEAHKLIDEFKDTSPSCAECGFFLSLSSNSSLVRNFGLKLVDHYIKLHWNSVSCDEKLSIKNNVLQILSKDVSFQEESHVKDALARIVVEIIKREWPQQWPSLLDELHTLCIIGDVQTELVLLIFLRLAEDIVQFQNVPDKRRREVYRALCGHLTELLKFFISTLSNQCEKYFVHKNTQVQQPDPLQNHCRVAHVALETLSVFVEWIPINHIAEESDLFKQLCHLLDHEALQIDAARCLLSLVERKGKPEDRKPILNLFEESELFKSRSQSTQTLEQYHIFLKILGQTLVTLGTNLSYLMGMFKDVKEPENFSMYLNCVLSLTKHPSVVISQCTQALWSALLRDKKLSQSSAVQSIIPNLLKYETEKLFKGTMKHLKGGKNHFILGYSIQGIKENIGFHSKQNSKASQFSLIEFDCDEDFENAYHKLRSEASEILKLISKQHPELAFNIGSLMLKSLLSNQPSPIILEVEDSNCLDDLSIWDAVVHYMDAVCLTLMRNITSPSVENLSKEGVELLQLTLTFNSKDLYARSYVLSCTSSLFFFANFCMDALVPVIRKIFSYLMCQPVSGEKNFLPKDVLNLRRHASSLLIKLCSTQSKLLLPVFDDLCRSVKDLVEKPEHLSALEKSALLEALMILSNELCDYDKQLRFLNEIVSPVIGIWLTDDMKRMLSSPEHFIAFIGLNESPDESNDAFQKNKSQLLLICNVIKTCAKRCKIVTNPDIAEKGNFIHPLSQNLNTVLYRNPAAQLLCPTFPAVFYLIRSIHSLHDPTVQAKIHPGFAGVTDISEADKNGILGVSNIDTNHQPKNAFERMKTYIHGIHDSCLHTLGDAAESIMIDFYMISNLSGYLNDCLFHCLPYLPDFKLRPIIRTFLKPFFYRCPVNLCGDLVNILAGFCNFMFQKLTTVWQKFKQRYGTCIGYEEQMTELQEVYEDQLNRILTREYIAFLGVLLQSKPVLDASENQMDDDSKINSSNNSIGQPKQLSELGLKIFQTEAVRGAITCTAFDGLHWLDTVTNIYCLNICDLVFKQLLKDNLIQQIHEANYLLQNALHGLQELGEHDSNQGLLLSFAILVYENLRPKFPDLREALISSVGCHLQAVEKMENLMFKEGIQRPGIEKQKREAFKQVVQKIIGKNLGQYHKRDIVIKNLPPLFIVAKEKTDMVPGDEYNGLCNLFVPSC